MAVLENLQPERVFHYFEEICSIPHGSGNTEAISAYLENFAKEKNLECYRDSLGNVIMIKEAGKGCENADPVIIQGHMDMVAVATENAAIDMAKDGLLLAVDGDWVYAKETSLGGDDGIAVAYTLAVLEDDSLIHPRIEAVFTVEEEVGMDGARGIDLSVCKAKKMLNIDSEEEGYLLTGCAGGATFTAEYPIKKVEATGKVMELTILGLQGGHSGVEIHRELGNANLLMGRVLLRLIKTASIQVIDLEGGKKDNAIPPFAKADILVPQEMAETVMENVKALEKELKQEYIIRDPGLQLACVEKEQNTTVHAVDMERMKDFLEFILVMPRGVCAMSPSVPGLVETSLNLGVLKLEEEYIKLGYAVRSSVDSAKEELLERMEMLCNKYGVKVHVQGRYPGWEYRPVSPLRDLMCEIYREMYGKEMVVQAIHAGVECGFFARKIEGLDCVSFGPDMKDIHTPRERLSIESTGRVYEYLVEVLKRLAQES